MTDLALVGTLATAPGRGDGGRPGRLGDAVDQPDGRAHRRRAEGPGAGMLCLVGTLLTIVRNVPMNGEAGLRSRDARAWTVWNHVRRPAAAVAAALPIAAVHFA